MNGNRRWWTLGAVSFALFMIMLDNTIVNVALPSIGRGLEIGVSQLEWVVNAHTLSFAVLMLTGGRIADLYGRRLVSVVGLAVFTLSYALIEANDRGWSSPLILALFAAAAALLGAFVLVERRAVQPMLFPEADVEQEARRAA